MEFYEPDDLLLRELSFVAAAVVVVAAVVAAAVNGDHLHR